MKYYMPTIVLEEDDIVLKSEELFKSLGKKALIVSGKTSAKKCGALDDLTTVFDKIGIEYLIFDKVIENPPIFQNVEGAIFGEGCDFVIGIGGGSPMDTAKGIAVLLKHGAESYMDKLFGSKDYDALPVIAIPTTSGTGSEVTPYSVFTDDELKTKRSMARRVFPLYALLDIKYFMTMPIKVRNSTIVDAFTHAVESFINTKSTPYSELFSLKAIEIFAKYKEELFKEEIDKAIFREFMRASTYAGVAISQTGTSLPHTLGYPLTYHYSVPHGIANAIFMAEYFKVSPKLRVAKLLEILNFEKVEDFGSFMDKIVGTYVDDLDISEEEIRKYTELLLQNKKKLKNHPLDVTREDVLKLYRESLGR